MSHEIAYSLPAPLTSTITVPTSITTSEADLFIITDQKVLRKSQITILFDVTLGSATKVGFRYYLWDGTTWYPIPIKNLSSGELTDVPSLIDSSSYLVTGSQYRSVEEIPLTGGMGFKITGVATGATATLNTLAVYVKDN